PPGLVALVALARRHRCQRCRAGQLRHDGLPVGEPAPSFLGGQRFGGFHRTSHHRDASASASKIPNGITVASCAPESSSRPPPLASGSPSRPPGWGGRCAAAPARVRAATRPVRLSGPACALVSRSSSTLATSVSLVSSAPFCAASRRACCQVNSANGAEIIGRGVHGTVTHPSRVPANTRPPAEGSYCT